MKSFFQPLFLLLPLFHQALAAPVPDALAKASPVATDSSIVPREADVFQDLLDILKGVEANNTKRADETEAEPIPILLETKDALSVGGLIGSLNGILNGLPKINIKRDANANAEALGKVVHISDAAQYTNILELR